MKWPLLALLLATLPATGAVAGDFALCQQSVDAELKFAGCNGLLLRDPKFAEAYSGRALALVAQGETERAIADYSYAIGLDPGLMVAYYNRGLSYLEIDEPALAAEDFDSVIARNPGDATAYNGRALAYAGLGKYDEAEADFTRAIALDPNYARALVGRGNLTLSRRLYETALKDFERALAVDPGNQDAIIGRSYASTGALPAELEAVGSTTPLASEPAADLAAIRPRVPQVKANLALKGPRLATLPKPSSPPKAALPKIVKTTTATVLKTKPPTNRAEKPLFNPSVTERSCNNYQGEPCAVSSK